MISVITGTHHNGEALERAISSLEAQAYTDWQHVVVADGPDPKLRSRMAELGYAASGKRVFIELGRNWHGFLGGDRAGQPEGSPGGRGGRGSRGVSVYLVATYLAAGEFISYLDDDCAFEPHHLELCAARLADTGSDFAYARMVRIIDGRDWDLIGDGVPGWGRIDGNMIVHRAELLKTANWRWGGDADWDLIGRWMAKGATFSYIPQITIKWYHAGDDV